jgi:hypothetical protein
MTTGDGIHYNRVARKKYLAATLQVIVAEQQVDVPRLISDLQTDIGGPDYLNQHRGWNTQARLIDALVERTDCDRSTASGHLARWLRKLPQWRTR